MSYNLGKRLRQPGGRLIVCRPGDPAQIPEWEPPTAAPCDCWFCDNRGRPGSVFVGFGGFANPPDSGSAWGCTFLNGGQAGFWPDPPTGQDGWLAKFDPGLGFCGPGVADDDILYLSGDTSPGCVCGYVTDVMVTPLGGGKLNGTTSCANFGPEWFGTRTIVWIGWSVNNGVFVAVQLYGVDPSQAALGLVALLYQWQWTHLDKYNGGWPVGQIHCGGSSTDRNSLQALLNAATADQGAKWVFESRWVAPNGEFCYPCDSGVVFGDSQPDAVVGLLFSEGGDSKVAPPCCCGGPQKLPCLFLCLQCAGMNCAMGLCDDGKGNFTGQNVGGPCDGLSAKLVGSGGSWKLTWNGNDCTGSHTFAPSEIKSTSPLSLASVDGVVTVHFGPGECGGFIPCDCGDGTAYGGELPPSIDVDPDGKLLGALGYHHAPGATGACQWCFAEGGGGGLVCGECVPLGATVELTFSGGASPCASYYFQGWLPGVGACQSTPTPLPAPDQYSLTLTLNPGADGCYWVLTIAVLQGPGMILTPGQCLPPLIWSSLPFSAADSPTTVTLYQGGTASPPCTGFSGLSSPFWPCGDPPASIDISW